MLPFVHYKEGRYQGRIQEFLEGGGPTLLALPTTHAELTLIERTY